MVVVPYKRETLAKQCQAVKLAKMTFLVGTRSISTKLEITYQN